MNFDKTNVQDLLQTCYDICTGNASDAIAKENANKDANSIPVIRDLIAGTVSKELAKYMLPIDVMDAHNKGFIHVHDLDYSPASPYYNCCLVNASQMLDKGFKLNGVQMSKPKNITSAASLLSQIIAAVSSHQYGGTSIDDVDIMLGEYVAATYKKHLCTGRKFIECDAKAVIYATEQTKIDTYQALQGLEYRINTLASCSGQTPFVTLGFGLGVTWQERLVQETILQVRLEGLGDNKSTAIFPKLVYKVDLGINHEEGDVNWDIYNLAIKCAAKRNYPDLLYMPTLREHGRGCVPMGCRSFLHSHIGSQGELEWFGRNNLGVVSLNLPRIAIESQCNIEMFWQILRERVDLCKIALDSRIDRLRGVKAKVAPILYCEGALGHWLNPEDEILQIFENGRASISLGYIGLYEVAQLMFNKSPYQGSQVDSEVTQFLINVVKFLKDSTDNWKNENGFGYGVYATPSEGLCKRFCELDFESFGEIEHVTDKGYYTNSFHMEVSNSCSPMVKIDFESQFVKYSSSGFITFVEVPNVSDTYREVYIKTCWEYARGKIGYLGTNTLINECYNCQTSGFVKYQEDLNKFMCENCNNSDVDTMSIVARVCGYMGNPLLRPWNSGKMKELKRRVKHS